MKRIKREIRNIASLLTLLLLIQSCSVYRSQPISLEKASQIESNVRVITESGNRFKFKQIRKEGNVFYGLMNLNDPTKRIILKEEFTIEVKEKNKTLSTILSIGIPVIYIGGALILNSVGCCGLQN